MQAPNRAGQILGNYRLMSLLGRGGYAEVYLAENIHLGVQAAIKVLKSRDLDSLEREEFRTEAKIMTTLQHPRIIRVYDYGIEMSQRGSGNDGSTPYLVMEYAPVGTLRHIYSHGTQMPPDRIMSYTKQIAEALQYAHDKDITHRDVKPENMLVRKPDDVALSDFGIAATNLNTSNLQKQQEEILRKMARGEQISVPGTAAYLAPERLLGQTLRASDQYSLAVIVYEWLCGMRPFQGSDLEICQKHTSEAPPPLRKNFPYIPQEVEQVVMKALSKDPAGRYPSVQAFALALENAISAAMPKVMPSAVPPSPPPYVPVSPVPATLPSPPPHVPVSPPPVVPPSPYPPYVPPSLPPGLSQTNLRQQIPGNNFPPPASTPQTSQRQVPRNNFPPPVSMPHVPQWNQPPIQGQGPQNPAAGPNMPWDQHRYTPLPDLDPTIDDANPNGSATAAKPKTILEDLSDMFNEPVTRTKQMFVSDSFFISKRRTRSFLLLGVPANILSALIALVSGPLPSSVFAAVIGGAFSVLMLWRCAVSVKKPIAIAFGSGVALWWGYVAASAAAHLKDGALEALSFLIAFLISLGIHIWYVNNRLKN
ncbi:MAG TPA: protein kinase [Ktedonobacteraceae bacterium]|nr:protein kinase [Ktedonobacteraceae bacterium]